MQCLRNRVQETSKSSFLTQLFQSFKANGVDYAVARDYGIIPERLEGRDLDIVVRSGELERAYNAVQILAKKFSAFVLRIEQDYSLFLLVIHSQYTWALRIDLNLPHSNTWRGCCVINLESALQNKISERGFDRFPDKDIFFMQFCRDIFYRLDLRGKYHSQIRKLYLADSVWFEKKLRELFGKRCAARLSEICSQGNFRNLKKVGKQLRRAVLMKSFIREPALTAQNMVRYFCWRCREYIKPNGLMVALVRADEAESEVLVESVRRDITKLLQYKVRVYRSRALRFPNTCSWWAGLAGNRRSADSDSLFANGKFFNTLRLIYYILDYIVGYWFVMRHWLGRKNIVAIFEFCLYDYLVTPTRFLFCLPKWMINFFSIFVPKPDIVIFLLADGAAIKTSELGLSIPESRRQMFVMEEFTHRINNFVSIDTSGDMIISKRAMRNTILQKLKKKLE